MSKHHDAIKAILNLSRIEQQVADNDAKFESLTIEREKLDVDLREARQRLHQISPSRSTHG